MSPRGIYDPAIRTFLDRPRFGTLSTIDADGAPFAAVVWYDLEGDAILINTAEGRRWPANLRRDPRCSFMVEDRYDYVQVLGRAQFNEDQERGQAQLKVVAAKYLTNPELLATTLNRLGSMQRILITIVPDQIFAHGKPAANQE
jgi:PPOX class probable F420-dependent enzyme